MFPWSGYCSAWDWIFGNCDFNSTTSNDTLEFDEAWNIFVDEAVPVCLGEAIDNCTGIDGLIFCAPPWNIYAEYTNTCIFDEFMLSPSELYDYVCNWVVEQLIDERYPDYHYWVTVPQEALQGMTPGEIGMGQEEYDLAKGIIVNQMQGIYCDREVASALMCNVVATYISWYYGLNKLVQAAMHVLCNATVEAENALDAWMEEHLSVDHLSDCDWSQVTDFTSIDWEDPTSWEAYCVNTENAPIVDPFDPWGGGGYEPPDPPSNGTPWEYLLLTGAMFVALSD